MRMERYILLLLILLVTIATTYGIFVPEPLANELGTPKNYTLCPKGCECTIDYANKTVECQIELADYSVTEFDGLKSTEWKLTKLRVLGGSTSWNSESSRTSVRDVLYKGRRSNAPDSEVERIFSELTQLVVEYVPIHKISHEDFIDMSKLKVLALVNNNISMIESNSFKNQPDLLFLNLEGNHISNLSEGLFNHLNKLKELRLRSNDLSIIKESQLSGMTNLGTLDLQNNRISQIDTFVQVLNKLQTFNVQRNQLMYISENSVEKLLSFKFVYINDNPFMCTCSLRYLLSAYKADNSVFLYDDIECYGPEELKHTSFTDVDIDLLPCNGANVTGISHGSSLLYQSDLVLDCEVSGDAPLVTYWITPWGERFTTESAKSLFPDQLSELKVSATYHALNLLVTSNVYMSDNGSLHIEKYRGYFAGNFTCVGVNLVGLSNETMHLGIETKLPYLYITSLYIGAFCSGGMLILAMIIGSIRLFVNKCLHTDQCNCCCCRCEDVQIVEDDDVYKVADVEVNVNCGSSVDTIEYIDYDPSRSPPDPPVNSPMSRLSPGVCRTPNNEEEDQSESKDVPSPPIWDQLEEVRFRLRCGAERRIRKVRYHVRTVTDAGSMKIRNIKDAGSMKIQHIRETSSNAASKVKNHVTSGMVQMKYGMQSIKEFCGTGDLGPGTVSMVSVSTDVDTKEQVQIVKSHTFV